MERVIGERGVRRGHMGADVERRESENRLPWLEATEDEDNEEGGRFWRMLLILLVLAALAAGGAWYYFNHARVVRPDGSLVRAEQGPYKVRPDQPGGKEFAGTGDSAYAVSEGEFREATLGEEDSGAAPDESPAEAPASATIQLGAYMDEETAETGWSTLVQRNPGLSGVKHRVIQGRADIGNVYRLQAIAESTAAAKQLCRDLKDAGTDCYVRD